MYQENLERTDGNNKTKAGEIVKQQGIKLNEQAEGLGK